MVKKRILSFVLALTLCLSMLPVGGAWTAAADGNVAAALSIFAAGDGTASAPYEIPDRETLAAFRDYINTDTKHGSGLYFKLTRDIDLNGSDDSQWTPIGTMQYPFAGTFDGGKHKVSGLYINRGEDYQSLFGYITNGTVKNLTVKGTILASGNVGGIVGTLYPNNTTNGRIENCEFEGEIGESGNRASNMSVGGIVGCNHGGTVTGCHFTGTITRGTEYVGGIVGQNVGISPEVKAVVENCYNEGAISISGNLAGYAGGIAGFNNVNTQILDCRNSGTVNGAGSAGVIGGIAGANSDGKIKRCYNAGLIDSVDSSNAGGISGQNSNSGEITECYNAGAVAGTARIGGIVGQNYESAKVTNCYNGSTGSVSAKSYAGGIVGQNYNGTSSRNTKVGKVANCYNIGSVTGSSRGGIVGANGNSYGTGKVTNCYYLTGTSVGGIDGADSDANNVKEKTVAQFNSGEVAWMLQKPEKVDSSYSAQSELIWVQELVNTPKDPYPLLVKTELGAGHPKVLRVTFKTKANSNYATEYTNSGGTVKMPADPPVNPVYIFMGWRVGDVNGDTFTGLVTATDDIDVVAIYRDTFGAEDALNTVITTTYGQAVEQDLDLWISYSEGTSSSGKFTYTITDYGGLKNVVLDNSKLTVSTGNNAGEYTLSITAHEKEPQIALLSVGSYGVNDVTLTVKVIINKADLTADMFTFKPPDNLSCNGEPKAAAVTLNDGYVGVGSNIRLKYYKVNDYGIEEALDGAPTDSGKYIVKIDVDEGLNYNSTENLTAESWTFELSYTAGGLTVTAKVTGNMADKDKAFTYKVALSDNTVSGLYGDMEFTNGIATFTLKNGESMNFTDLPDGITFTVTQSGHDSYAVKVEGSFVDSDKTLENGDVQCSGNIISNETAQVIFVNTRNMSVPTDATSEYGWMIPFFILIIMGLAFFAIKRLGAVRRVSITPKPHSRR